MPRPYAIARMQSANNAFLVDSGTVARTGKTVACSVGDATSRTSNTRGFPPFTTLTARFLSFKLGSDIKPGDEVVVAGKGTYVITDVEQPTSLDLVIISMAVQTRLPDGSLNIFTTEQVTFQNPSTGLSIAAGIYTYPAAKDLERFEEASGYTWAFVFDWALTYSDGKRIGANHKLLCGDILGYQDGPNGTVIARSALISRPRREVDLISYGVAYFKEP